MTQVTKHALVLKRLRPTVLPASITRESDGSEAYLKGKAESQKSATASPKYSAHAVRIKLQSFETVSTEI